MSTVTKTTTLDQVTHDRASGTVTVVWRDHFLDDGVEIDAARVARTKTYSQDDKTQFDADLGANAANYAGMFAS